MEEKGGMVSQVQAGRRWGGVEDVTWNHSSREGWKRHERDLWMGGQREMGKAGIL